MIAKLKEKLALLQEVRALPQVTVSLNHAGTLDNHEFYQKITKDFYDYAHSRHKKLPLIRALEYGVALFDFRGEKPYLQAIESSARRNYKKALRNGFHFEKIDFNQHLDDIWDIRKSTPVRQGEMPEEFITQPPKPVNNPITQTNTHDYPYFGIFNAEKKLVAYAGCMVAGDILMVQHIYGHHEFQSFGVVPCLLISIAENALESYPNVKFYNYGTFYGAQAGMQRFKKKFRFLPHRVTWTL